MNLILCFMLLINVNNLTARSLFEPALNALASYDQNVEDNDESHGNNNIFKSIEYDQQNYYKPNENELNDYLLEAEFDTVKHKLNDGLDYDDDKKAEVMLLKRKTNDNGKDSQSSSQNKGSFFRRPCPIYIISCYFYG